MYKSNTCTEITMGDDESELWADLREIDDRRRQSRDTLEKLRYAPNTSNASKSSLVSDSGIDIGQNSYEDSMAELMGKVIVISGTGSGSKWKGFKG
jgi:hypothetical protein